MPICRVFAVDVIVVAVWPVFTVQNLGLLTGGNARLPGGRESKTLMG